MKTTNSVRKAGLVAAIIGVLVSIIIANQMLESPGTSKDLGKQCQFVNDRCAFILNEGKGLAMFNEAVEIEEWITVNIELPKMVKPQRAWIEGVNMYMGRTMVGLTQQGDGWQGEFMLGSCTEPKMQWRMVLKIEDRQQPVYLYFSTEI